MAETVTHPEVRTTLKEQLSCFMEYNASVGASVLLHVQLITMTGDGG